MMKYLYVMRHADTIDKVPSGSDFERYLLPQGVFRAQQQADYFLTLSLPKPQLIKTSNAWRASQTATIFASVMNSNMALELIPQMYNSNSDVLLQIIHQTSEEINALLIVAHNFGVSDLASKLIGQNLLLSPAGFMAIQFDSDRWQDIYFNGGEQIAYGP